MEMGSRPHVIWHGAYTTSLIGRCWRLRRHNCHHYFAFFQAIRDAIASDESCLSSLEHQLQSCDRSRDQERPVADDRQLPDAEIGC